MKTIEGEHFEAICQKVHEALLDNSLIDLEVMNLTLTHIEFSNCQYCDKLNEMFCDEQEVEVEVDPVDYMSQVIPKAIEEFNDKKRSAECLVYLERDLLKREYKGLELDRLSKFVDEFRGWFSIPKNN